MVNTNYWWEKKETNGLATAVASKIRQLRSDQQYIYTNARLNRQLYSNLDYISGVGAFMSATSKYQSPIRERSRWNLALICCSSLKSKIAKSRPKPFYLSSGGDYSLRKKCKLLNQFTVGQFDSLEVYKKSASIFLDAAINGTAIIHIDINEEDKIIFERVSFNDFTIDNIESLNSDTPLRQCFISKPVAREILERRYPKLSLQIKSATYSMHEDCPPQQRNDYVTVHEA
jgi:hypothetical protein